jgi:LEA14-like dessication related protein
MKKLTPIFVITILLTVFASCKKEDLFTQPSLDVTGISLKELPKDSAHLSVTVKVTDNDKREANIADVDYNVSIEGYKASEEHQILNKSISPDAPLTLTLPLTLATDDAIQLLKKLNKGESLSYTVTGTFHVNDKKLKTFDLPLNISGKATVDVGFDDFFKQPTVHVDSIGGTYSVSGNVLNLQYTFNLLVHCSITNNNSTSAEIDEVNYVVTTEGVKSDKEKYSDTHTKNIIIDGNQTINVDLAVKYVMGNAQGAELLSGLTDGSANYIVEGTFHTIKVGGQSADFKLPLYEKGSVPVTSLVQAK